MQPNEVFNLLNGNWRIMRTIHNQGHMQGFARFTRITKNKILYREEGILELNDNAQKLKVYREYIYIYKDETIFIYFYENKKPTTLLHKLNFLPMQKNPNNSQAIANHQCKKDHYHALYLFFSNCISLQYRIHGPKKNHFISTVFVRL